MLMTILEDVQEGAKLYGRRIVDGITYSLQTEEEIDGDGVRTAWGIPYAEPIRNGHMNLVLLQYTEGGAA